MPLEAVVVAAASAIALFPLIRCLWRSGWRGGKLGGVAAYLAAVLLCGWAAASYHDRVEAPPVTDRPIRELDNSYVSSDTCRPCHPQPYATWRDSYHSRMTQVVGPDTVIADFAEARVTFAGLTYKMFRRGDSFWVELPDPDWLGEDGDAPIIVRQLVMSTGSHHMQMYWYPSGRNRKIGSLPIVYLREEERWVPRNAVFVRPPGRFNESETSRWNYLCIQCHATHGRTRPIPPDTMDTKVAEFGIACEACHGPAEEHVEANRNPLRRYALHDDGDARDETVVDPSKLNHRRSAEVCGQCHSIAMEYREEVFRVNLMQGNPYRPGNVLGATHPLARGRESDNPPAMKVITDQIPHFYEESFWSDGTVRVSGREYNGLVETPCFQRGEMSCLSCHILHQEPDDERALDAWRDDQLKPGMRGNLACTQCHERYRDDATVEAHTHHKAESTGSNCYNCHMPYTTYGLLKGIRSHTVISPTAQESIEIKRPNACNQCHLDKTLLWTAEHLDAWYETPQPVLDPDERAIAASLLWLFRGDAGLRALTAWSMGWEDARTISGGDDWIAPHLARTLADPYDAVRFISGRSLQRLEGFEDFDYDFMATSGVLAAAPRSALQRWSRLRAGREVTEQPGTVLLNDSGLAMESEVLRLLRQRDDSRVVLAE